MRFVEAFAAGFKGRMAVFAAFSADVWVGVFVATGLIFFWVEKRFFKQGQKIWYV